MPIVGGELLPLGHLPQSHNCKTVKNIILKKQETLQVPSLKWLTLCAQGVMAFVALICLKWIMILTELTCKASVSKDWVPELEVATVRLKTVVHLRRSLAVKTWLYKSLNGYKPFENLTLQIIEWLIVYLVSKRGSVVFNFPMIGKDVQRWWAGLKFS